METFFVEILNIKIQMPIEVQIPSSEEKDISKVFKKRKVHCSKAKFHLN